MNRRPRGLHPEERELWHKVASTARAMHPDHPVRPDRTDKEPPRKPQSLFQAFRLGDAARPLPLPHNLAPTLQDHLTKQPLRMDRRAFEKMARGKLHPEARIDLGLSQSDLAAVLGATRPRVNNALQDLITAGAIRRDGTSVICNLPRLEALAAAAEAGTLF